MLLRILGLPFRLIGWLFRLSWKLFCALCAVVVIAVLLIILF